MVEPDGLKAMMLSIIYDESAVWIAQSLPCSLHEAHLHLIRFGNAYPRLVESLRGYLNVSLGRG